MSIVYGHQITIYNIHQNNMLFIQIVHSYILFIKINIICTLNWAKLKSELQTKPNRNMNVNGHRMIAGYWLSTMYIVYKIHNNRGQRSNIRIIIISYCL